MTTILGTINCRAAGFMSDLLNHGGIGFFEDGFARATAVVFVAYELATGIATFASVGARFVWPGHLDCGLGKELGFG